MLSNIKLEFYIKEEFYIHKDFHDPWAFSGLHRAFSGLTQAEVWKGPLDEGCVKGPWRE